MHDIQKTAARETTLSTACATDGTKLLVKSNVKASTKILVLGHQLDLSIQSSTRLDWSVKNAIVNLLVRLKGNTKHISGNLSSLLLGAQKKHIRLNYVSSVLNAGFSEHSPRLFS